jgi:hypothetical protein
VTVGSTIIDIETGPLPSEELTAMMPPFAPEEVKCGNLKAEKAVEKRKAAEAEYAAKFMERAALSPLTGRVLTIGYLSPGFDHGDMIDTGDGHEEVMLHQFWAYANGAKKNKRRMIGHNIYGFDLPFLVRRSWKYGIPVPEWILERGRYWSPVFIDTMQVWCVGGRDTFASLNTLARFFGVGGKPDGVSGADFARMFLSEDPAERLTARSYLKNDLQITAAVAECMDLV